MLDLNWTWLEAAVMAAVFFLAQVTVRRGRRARAAYPFLREAALVCSLYALWQVAAVLSQTGTYAAVGRGARIWDAERAVHFPSEQSVQGWILPHPVIVQTTNLYYDTMHFTVMFAALIWLFIRHRDVYPHWRTAVALFTAQCLFIQLIPVAPPRMVPSTGMIDTAVRYGQSVYHPTSGFQADALSAMPSVHIGWALLVAACMMRVAPSPWRYLGALYAASTIFAVVATGNHYWADGFVAALLVAGTLAGQTLLRRRAAVRGEFSEDGSAVGTSAQVDAVAHDDGVTHADGFGLVEGDHRVGGAHRDGGGSEPPSTVRRRRE